MTLIKICGLKDAAGVAAALEAGASHLGFVLVAASPRAVTPEQAAALAAPARGRAAVVAVVADPSDAALAHIADALAPDVIQLHGAEGAGRLDQTRALTRAEPWKAIAVTGKAALDGARLYRAAERLVLDAPAPAGADRGGGHGAVFDWTALAGWRAPTAWILSGGLTPGNVADAVRATGADGVDVSSGVEDAPGVKNPAKIAAFVLAARAAWAAAA